MAIEGPLKELGIHDVFQLLDLSRKTGKLTVTSKIRHNRGSVYFREGSIVYAEIESNPHLLGAFLVRTGRISEGDVQQARDMQVKGDKRRLGEILVDIDAITERELERQVQSQVEEVVFELVGWQEGYFSFEEGDSAKPPADALVSISTSSLLMEGARRIDEWSRIERRVAHLGVIPGFAPQAADDTGEYLDLLPPEWEVLTAVDSERDVKEIALILGRSEFDVAKTLFGLEATGILTLREPVSESVAPVAEESDLAPHIIRRAERQLEFGNLEAARELMEEARSAHPHDAVVHLILGKIDLTEKRPEQAEEYLRRALRIDPMLADAHRLLGDALALLGRYPEAVEWWQRWLTISEHAEQEEREVERVKEALRTVEKLDLLLENSSG
jgi:predicted transcriptional regulator